MEFHVTNGLVSASAKHCYWLKKSTIVSLWDMLQINTTSFLASLTYISGSIGEFRLILQMVSQSENYRPVASLEQRALLLKAVQDLKNSSAHFGLKSSERFAQIAFETCLKSLAGQFWYMPSNLGQSISSLEILLNSAVIEAESRKFYVLSSDVLPNHDDADVLFGPEVIDAFPQAAFDISEAGKCRSFGLWTACVMHLMRVLETGLNALANMSGIVPSENWNKTLNEIEAHLRSVRKASDGPEAEQWAAEAGTHLRFIKNAWRNQAMHVASKYDEQDAKTIFENTRAFLKHLAQKMSE